MAQHDGFGVLSTADDWKGSITTARGRCQALLAARAAGKWSDVVDADVVARLLVARLLHRRAVQVQRLQRFVD